MYREYIQTKSITINILAVLESLYTVFESPQHQLIDYIGFCEDGMSSIDILAGENSWVIVDSKL